ncbi:Serine/threonine-protein kinase ppk6 [Madurella fahalii]|uniref:Serine/threonine-protein kinase ppk6 n=1 Tax=Madurella fahalii TaxID=1157608 RepID=A0ABQ0GS79_9PEZI
MSADLFAAFGDSPQTSSAQSNQPKSNPISNPISAAAASAAAEPFSFLSFDAPASQPQSGQKPAPWPSFQQPTTRQTTSQPQTNSAWGDIGGLGSLGGLGSFPGQHVPSSAAQKAPQQEEDDDGWGDFEVAPAYPPPQPAAPSTMTGPPRTRVTRASTLDMLSNKLLDLGLETSTPAPWQERPSWEKDAKTQQPPRKPARNPDPNVLFDVDFEAANGANGADDEFGDFETGATGAITDQAATTKSALDLLSLDSAPAPPKKQPLGLSLSNAAFHGKSSSYPEAPKSPYGSFHDRKPEPVKQLQVQPLIGATALGEPSQASPSPVTAWPSVENDGFGSQWEEFRDLSDTTKPVTTKPGTTKPLPKVKSRPAATSAPTLAPEWDWQDWGGTDNQPAATSTTTKTTLPSRQPQPRHQSQPQSQPQHPPSTDTDKPGPPPTNIPPPSILLSLFPQLLDLASASLLKPLLTLSSTSPAYQRVLSSPATLAFLKGYLALATVAGRLIAGRKQRWHRDKFLSQSMSISAAPGGGGGGGSGQRGMKLASVDKAQSAREDREAAEVVAAWKAQVGRLRTVVAGVNAAQRAAGADPPLRVPELGLAMAVSTAKGVPTAPRACVVCGLKRDERVAKVDLEVEDSFGEWWVDFWGHRECRNFWIGHEKELRQR